RSPVGYEVDSRPGYTGGFVEDEAAGLGIRESAGPVTDEYARFLPHVIL
ncbi:glutathionylspermidine synthase family protein, partial [Streptomyces cavourensis]|nr:glutathionylspermidine synthase family protein [Streptomyces cavourensis]